MSININLVNIAAKVKDLQKDKKKDIYTLFIDLKRAFVSVDHKTLFGKMEKMNID
jgi:1,4-dihydroxy-2-naphthoate octaprenyltransferase